jgi:predicted TIM-barrel fold metal-dependent hydrolase
MFNLNVFYDMHIHPYPDIRQRKFTDEELAQRMQKAGFAGFTIKAHFSETASRAKLLQDRYPDLFITGGIALNRSVGGFNPFAVETCAKMGGKIVWMPTMESRSYQQCRHPELSPSELKSYLSVFDENGKLLPAVHDVLDVAKAYDMIVATGHISAKEGIAVLSAAKEHGIEKMVVTHADNDADYYTVDEQKICVNLGAYIEHCYFTVYKKRTPLEEILSQIQQIGANHIILSTDFGQMDNPYPDEGMIEFANRVKDGGVPEEEIEIMFGLNAMGLLK